MNLIFSEFKDLVQIMCCQTRITIQKRKLRICSHLLKKILNGKSLMENFIFRATPLYESIKKMIYLFYCKYFHLKRFMIYEGSVSLD